MKHRSFKRLLLSQTPPLRPPSSWISQRSPSIFITLYQRGNVRRDWEGNKKEGRGGSVCVNGSHNSGVRSSESEGKTRRTSRRGCCYLWRPLKPRWRSPSLSPSPVGLSRSSLPLWAAAGSWVCESVNGMPRRCARWGVTDENRSSGVDGDPPVSVPPLLGEIWAPGVSTTTIMGCNLCTLQKREEHYKLLYEIAQVSECWHGRPWH